MAKDDKKRSQHTVGAVSEPNNSGSNTSELAPDTEAPWLYPTNAPTDGPLLPTNLDPVSWTASEFIDHDKNNSWFMGLAAITGVAVAIIYLITHDVITAVAIAVAAALFGVTAKRKPRTLNYELDNIGVHIGSKTYDYNGFKAFSVVEEGAFNSIQLMPLKRFMPPISLYFPPDQEDQIISLLGNYLPHEDRTRDPIDRLMRKVRF